MIRSLFRSALARAALLPVVMMCQRTRSLAPPRWLDRRKVFGIRELARIEMAQWMMVRAFVCWRPLENNV